MYLYNSHFTYSYSSNYILLESCGILSPDKDRRNPNFIISTRPRMCHARGVSYRKRKIVACVGDGTPIVVADKRRLQHPFVSHSPSRPARNDHPGEISRLFVNDKCVFARYIERTSQYRSTGHKCFVGAWTRGDATCSSYEGSATRAGYENLTAHEDD